MKISSSAGNAARMDATRPASRAEGSSKAFTVKPKTEAATAPRSDVKTAAVESPVAGALRSVAADFRAGRIPSREEAVQKMVSTVLRERFGQTMTNDRGFQKMEHSIASLISDDPMLSKRMEHLLTRLV
jgi:hypothetical protein